MQWKSNSEFGIQNSEGERGARRERGHTDLFRTNVLHGMKNWEWRIENNELWMKNDEWRIMNDGLRMKDDEWRIENWELWMMNDEWWMILWNWLKKAEWMFVLCEGLRPIKLFAKCLQAKREVEIAEHKYGYSCEPFSLDVSWIMFDSYFVELYNFYIYFDFFYKNFVVKLYLWI